MSELTSAEHFLKSAEILEATAAKAMSAETDQLIDLMSGYEEADPTPWCDACGAMRKQACKCGSIADNE